MPNSTRNLILVLACFLSAAMHWPHFGKDLMSVHVWRQTQTQSNILNFYEEDMTIWNPRRNERGIGDGIYRMEFPLMQWSVAVLYKVLGPHIAVTRWAMFFIGIGTVLGMFVLLQTLFRQTVLSLMGAWAFNFSPCFFYYTINPLPDNMALAAAVWGLAFFFMWERKGQLSKLWWSGLFLSIGALCKLPFIIYFAVPLVYFMRLIWQKRSLNTLLPKGIAAFSLSILPLAWYAYVIPQWNGNIVLKGVLAEPTPWATLLDYYRFTALSTLPELLLNYGALPFFLLGFHYLRKRKSYLHSYFLPILGLSVVCLLYYVFEATAIADVHDYYLFPFYPSLFILVGYGAYHLYEQLDRSWGKYVTIGLLLLLPITCFLRMQGRWNPNAPGFNPDVLKYRQDLAQAAPKTDLVIVENDISHYIYLYYLDKKGWAFENNSLDAPQLDSLIGMGAKYLYTDRELASLQASFQPFLKEKVIERGSVRVYRLGTMRK